MALVFAAFLAAGCLSATVGFAAPGLLETSVERAQAMLIKEKLAEGIYVIRAPAELDYWTSTNSVVVVNDEDVVVFDSCTRAVTARAVIAEIRKLTPKPVRFLINSHWHQDHWSGNAEYVKAFPGLRIVASAETRAYMTHMGGKFFIGGYSDYLAKSRADLDQAIATGKLADGTPLTAEIRARKERTLARGTQFVAEVEALPRVLPDVTYQDAMTFWSGPREFRLMSVTGDATASTALYLPGDKVLVTGDVLVSPEDGNGPPPWTTNSYSVTPWLKDLRRLEALEAAVIVPGQGPVLHDKTYLRRTIQLFAAVIDQVQAALGRGVARLKEVQAAVHVDDIGRAYAPDGKLSEDFPEWLADFSKKAMQEALDGAGANVK
jgi:cyclase